MQTNGDETEQAETMLDGGAIETVGRKMEEGKTPQEAEAELTEQILGTEEE